jgi:hypothetical protein
MFGPKASDRSCRKAYVPKSLLFIILSLFLVQLSTTVLAEVPAQLRTLVAGLKKGQSVPPIWYKRYSTKVIAEALLDRHRSFATGSIDTKSKIVRFLQWKDFNEQINGGEFTTHFQKKLPERGLSKNERLLVEDGIFKAPLGVSPQDLKLRPKYGYMIREGMSKLHDSNYGPVVVVFKNNVKKRSTFMNGDSLNMYSVNRLQGIDKEKISTLTPHTFYEDLNTVPPLHNQESYYEVQMFGEINLEDVEEIWFPEATEYINEKTYRVLENSKLPIYNYTLNEEFVRIRDKAWSSKFAQPSCTREILKLFLPH